MSHVKDVLSNSLLNPTYNIAKEERKALQDLRMYGRHMVLTADKGVSLGIMDTDMHIKKIHGFSKGWGSLQGMQRLDQGSPLLSS